MIANLLAWPSQAPDLNPTVNAWLEIDFYRHYAFSITELELFYKKEWKETLIVYLQSW